MTPDRSRVLLTWNTPEHPASDELANDAYFTLLRSEGTGLGADAVRVQCAEESRTLDTSRGEYTFVCYDESWELGTAYTYGVVFTDWQGNESVPSNTVTVTTADRVAPQPVTGLTATPRADGTLLRWNASAEDDVASYRALRGVRQADGSVRWLGTCNVGQDDRPAALCIGVPDGESYVHAVYAVDKWGNATAAADWATVTATELDTTPAEPIGQDKGPLYGGGGWTVSEAAGPVQWHCSGDICASVTEYRVSRWNPATRTYGLLDTVAPTSDYWQSCSDPAQPLGSISYYRVVGVLADGTETAAAHPWRIRPDLA
ncbi:hypothetical protein ACLGIH_19125 [Streptomyces sp. HMX87]|uniref:hypothetical protein n=1 Tax=Streptomyces sp. HMX87 TaxID=3390849 RepID=UPI003A85C000